jgi:hypothetical protein
MHFYASALLNNKVLEFEETIRSAAKACTAPTNPDNHFSICCQFYCFFLFFLPQFSVINWHQAIMTGALNFV